MSQKKQAMIELELKKKKKLAKKQGGSRCYIFRQINKLPGINIKIISQEKLPS